LTAPGNHSTIFKPVKVQILENLFSTLGHRRLSGVLGSSASSPGSTPGTPIGFPIRRHSSAAFAQNRRYSSNALLSPSTSQVKRTFFKLCEG